MNKVNADMVKWSLLYQDGNDSERKASSTKWAQALVQGDVLTGEELIDSIHQIAGDEL